jgi:hypothetical protein
MLMKAIQGPLLDLFEFDFFYCDYWVAPKEIHHCVVCLQMQARYAQGTKEMLEAYFNEKPMPEENYIVREGELAEQYT